jgi:transposase
VVDIVEQLELSAMTRQYRGAGSAAYQRAMLLALPIYGYATGTYSSRRIEQATYDSLAFRYIAANAHFEHTLCAFRKRFLNEIKALLVQVLAIAKQMKLLTLGTVALDGTKVHARHRLKTQAGRELYGLRKQTVEPVFGIIKAVMGFRQFLLRGCEPVQGEWSLVTMAWNIRRMAVLKGESTGTRPYIGHQWAIPYTSRATEQCLIQSVRSPRPIHSA